MYIYIVQNTDGDTTSINSVYDEETFKRIYEKKFTYRMMGYAHWICWNNDIFVQRIKLNTDGVEDIEPRDVEERMRMY
jgi:hypothetical protein